MSVQPERPEGSPSVVDGTSGGPEAEEPAVLGAAATIAVDRRAGRSRSERRALRADQATAAGRRQDATTSGSGTTGEVAEAPRPEGYSGVEHVFGPHTTSVTPLGQYLRDIWERRPFLVELAKADLAGARSSTALGRIWSVLDPLFQAAIYYFLFTVIRGGQGRPLDFLHVLIAGIFLLGLSTSALTDGGRSITKSKGMMLNSTFPSALLPLTTLYSSLLGFVPAAGVYVLVHLVLGAPIGWPLLALPLLFAIQMVMSLGLALLTATVVVYFRDAQNVLNYITRIMFFATPVIYPVSLLPDGIRSVLAWQPLFPLFANYQAVLQGEPPDVAMLLHATAWAVFFLVLGTRVFRRYERGFAIRL